jgi:hypothetical protein
MDLDWNVCWLTERKGESPAKGRGATHAVPTNGRPRAMSACQRQGDAINVIIEKSAVIILHAVTRVPHGAAKQMGQSAQHPEAPRRSVFQTNFLF